MDVHRVANQVVVLQPAGAPWADIGVMVEGADADANPEARFLAAHQIFVFVTPDEKVVENETDRIGNLASDQDSVEEGRDTAVDSVSRHVEKVSIRRDRPPRPEPTIGPHAAKPPREAARIVRPYPRRPHDFATLLKHPQVLKPAATVP